MKMVYVFESSDGRVKIGVSKNPEKRIRTLSLGGGFDVLNSYISKETSDLISRDIEKNVHKMLSENRLNGEWFDVDFDIAKKCVQKLFIYGNDEFDYSKQKDNEQESLDWALGVSIRLKAIDSKDKIKTILTMMSKSDLESYSTALRLSIGEQYVYCLTWLANELMIEVQMRLDV